MTVTTIVLDTNVLVSGFLSPYGPPAKIVNWLRQGSIRLALDEQIAAEYVDVLRRPEFDLPIVEVEYVLKTIFAAAEWAEITPGTEFEQLPDPDDAPFVQCANCAGCPVVTGNKKHYPRDIVGVVQILSPSEFVKMISGHQNN